uniref:MULE transposase domain-containing protein n=1 Tax=Meloidogyne floridensis TaxID=298350 RepID=A0A915NRF8_9BILA
MGKQTEIKQSPTSIHVKSEQFQRRSSPRKRPAPKIEEEIVEDIVVDDGPIPETHHEGTVEEKKEEIEFVKGCTNRGFVCIWHKGYRYVKNRDVKVRHYNTYWRCSSKRCQAKAFAYETEDGKLMGALKNTHNHLPQPEKRLAEIKRQELKQRAREDPSLRRGDLIASIRAGIDDETFVALGSDDSLARLASREKIKLYGKGNTRKGSNVMSMQLPLALTERNGQSILLYDSRTARARDKDAVFVFAHPYMLQQLAGQTTWTIGTSFRLIPAPFKYCFVIATVLRSQLIVAAHALLTENSEAFYMEALDAISAAVKPTKPRRIITDFENVMVEAAQNVFQEAHVSGCYFRFSQELFRKWSEYNLAEIYGHENSQAGNIARMTFRRLICLALIPMAYVNRAFYKIVEVARLPQLAEFFFYFKEAFIGLTEQEFRMKSAAFGSNFEQNLVYSTAEEEQVYEEPNVGYQDYLNYEMPAHSSTMIEATPGSLQPLCHLPYCPLEFWNISERVATELVNANCAMEMAQLHTNSKHGSKFLPSLPDFILALWDDFEKQRDNIRAVTISNNKKRNLRKHIIKEELVISTLNEASYETDQAILNTLDILSHHVQNYVNGLFFDVKEIGKSGDDFMEFNEGLNSSRGSGGRMKQSTSGFR